jgi:hypothetical protein
MYSSVRRFQTHEPRRYCFGSGMPGPLATTLPRAANASSRQYRPQSIFIAIHTMSNTLRYKYARSSTALYFCVALILFGAIVFIVVAIVIACTSRTQSMTNLIPLMFGGGGAVFGLPICVAAALNTNSDIILSEEGISRSLWGYVWTALRWEEIQLIRIRVVRIPADPIFSTSKGATITYYSFYKTWPPNPWALFLQTFFLGRGMVRFASAIGKIPRTANNTLSIENMPELVEAINRYIRQYRIKIKDVSDGGDVAKDAL